MGRQSEEGLKYFKHFVDGSFKPTLFTIEEKFQNDGYAVWFKLLEMLGETPTLSLDFNNRSTWSYFLARVHLSNAEDRALSILDMLSECHAIDSDLWADKIVWVENLASNSSSVFQKRGSTIPGKPEICTQPSRLAQEDNVSDSADKKVKKSKPADTKVKYAEYVTMEQTEYDTLCKQYGKACTDKAIEELDNYKGSSGKTYKSDYRAILSWVIDKLRKNEPGLFARQVNSSIDMDNVMEELRNQYSGGETHDG